MVVVAEVVLSRDVDVLSQYVRQPATSGPAAPAAGGRGGRGGRGRGGGGGGGAVDRPADPVLHGDAPLPAGRGSSATSAVLFFTVSTAAVLVAFFLPVTVRVRGGV